MSEKRRGLGRGLGALIPDQAAARARPVDVFFADRDEQPADDAPPSHTAAGMLAEHGGTTAPPASPTLTPVAEDAGLAPVPGARYAEVPIDAIRPNPRQPRTVFDEDELAELVHSIREIGVLQPVVVRPLPEGSDAPEGVTYELIMGERRWRASRAAGRESVPAIVKHTEEDDLLRDALLENLHRSQLNSLEEAAAYQQLLDDFGCTQDELARRIGRSRPQISNTLRLLRLPPLVARRVAAGVLSAGHARALLGLEDGASMERLAQRIVAEGLSVRSVEEIVALGMEPEQEARSRAPRSRADNPELDDLGAALSDHLDTRAKITMGAKKGRMTIEFASVDDLTRILEKIGMDSAHIV
jgi:ParB family chromosome partitioning protein